MDDGSRASLIIVLVLILLAAFFAVAETALSSVSRNRIRIAADRGDARAKNALFVLDNFDRAITTLLICTNIVHIAAATMVTVAVTRIWGLSAVTLSTVIVTIVIFFAGEMLPKSIAKKNSMKFALATAGTVKFFMTVFRPLSALLTKIGQAAAAATGAEPEITVTEEELVDIIEDMEEEGSIDEDQSNLLQAAMDFDDTRVKKIMTPVEDMVGIDINAAPEEIFETVKDSNHSRLPIYKESRSNIVGMLQIRKYMKKYLKNHDYPNIRKLMDRVYYVGRNVKIDELLERMSRRKLNMAVIVGRDGRSLGIVTVEDILEELVGEIYDEEDNVPDKVKGGDVS
ncbi:MAG: hemolysin family protein [Lachnospiraceae bacterium]|nr:hemolysin family protein [Lachnospiraceae bacterium]